MLEGHTETVQPLPWSADGARLASGGEDRTIRVWNSDTGELVLTLRGHTDAVTAVAWSPDGRTLASAGADGTIRLSDPMSTPRRAFLKAGVTPAP